MSRTLKFSSAVVGFGVLLSQLGHLLVYELRFGSAAQTVQSTGAHAYFPALVKTGLGLGAAAILASLLLISAARLVAGPQGHVIAGGPSYVRVLGALFTIQLVFFALQESAETMAAGTAFATAPQLLLMGSVGQLPVAILGALALKWLLLRVESAVTQVRVALAAVPRPITPVAVVVTGWTRYDVATRPIAGAPLAQRGPPTSVRFSSY